MSALDKMALRSDIIASMLGHENGELQKSQYMDHLVELAELEQSEHQRSSIRSTAASPSCCRCSTTTP